MHECATENCGNSETEFRFEPIGSDALTRNNHKEKPMSTRFDNNSIRYSVLIHNADTLLLINELAVKFKNRNAVLNDALDIGVPILYARIFGKDVKQSREQKSHSPSVGREIKELRRVIDDLFIEMNVQETMLAGLYNALLAYLLGGAINPEGLLDGSLCDLPELVAKIKEDLIDTRKRSDE